MASNDEHSSTNAQQVRPNPTMPANQRRVLGDVSPNVKLASPALGMLKNGKPMTSSPLKRSFTTTAQDAAGLKYLKRRRLSDDEALSEQVQAGQDSGRRGSVFSGKRSASVEEAAEGSVESEPLLSETKASDDPSIPTVQQESPTEPNTPTSTASEPKQHSSEERRSFSSLINYDPSSQISLSNPHQQPAPAPAPTTQETNPTRSIPGMTRAQLLKLRLKVAMYKVETNQTHLPFQQLKHDGHDIDGKATDEAVEEAVAQLRREAQLIQHRRLLASSTTNDEQQQPVPKLLPAPLLRPTAYSSRMVYDEQDVPSSPPMDSPERETSRSPKKTGLLARGMATPAKELRRLGSPPGSVERASIGRVEEAELTSSVVKGRVAEGLLGLRNST